MLEVNCYHDTVQFFNTETPCCRSVCLEVSADDEISEPWLSEEEGCCGRRRCGPGVSLTLSEAAEK